MLNDPRKGNYRKRVAPPLRLDAEVARKARVAAAPSDQSLSKWIQGLVTRELAAEPRRSAAWRRMSELMETGFHLGGEPLTREAIHERQ